MSLEMAHKVILPPKKNYIPQFLKQRDINSYYIPMQLTDWLLVVVALLLIGLTQISYNWTKSGFDYPSVMESPLYLPPLLLYHIYR
jgi:hypothetical protein